MNILIIGAAGMLGRKLAGRLVSQGVINGVTIGRITLVDVFQRICPALERQRS